MKVKGLLPNTLTFTNLFLGFLAIVFTLEGKFVGAAWLIVLCAIMDALDGAAARLTKQSSPFGMEIDSFSDSISFGVAPSILIYKIFLENFGLLGVFLAFLPILAGVTRLVRFKILSSSLPKFRGFIGLPIPSTALILAGYFLFQHTLNDGVIDGKLYFSFIPALSLLMLSPIRYRRMPVFPISHSKYAWIGISILSISIISVLIWPGIAIFPVMMFYLLTGPVEAGYYLLKTLVTGVQHEDIKNETPNKRQR